MKRIIQIVLAVAVVGLAFWLWTALHPSPEKVVRSRMNALAKALSFKSGRGALAKAYSAEKVSEFFTPDVEVQVNLSGFEPIALHGRDEILKIVAAAEARLTSMKVEFPDMNVTFGADGQTAKVNLTGKATVPGERDISAQVTSNSDCRSCCRPSAMQHLPLSSRTDGIKPGRFRQRADRLLSTGAPRYRHCEPPQDLGCRCRMQHQRALQQARGGCCIVVHQVVDGGADQRLALAFHPLHRAQFGPTPAAGAGTMQHGAAKRTAFHGSRLKIE